MSLSRLLLERRETGPQGTFGKLAVEGEVLASLELPWEDNASNYSCIPKGVYKCVWNYSTRFKRNMYEITSVPGRAGIRIHSANFGGDDRKGWKKQLNGCLALGERFGVMDGQKAILVSKPAVRRFETLLNGREFELEIR